MTKLKQARADLAALRLAVTEAMKALGSEPCVYGCENCEVRIADGFIGGLNVCDKCATNAMVRTEPYPYAPALRKLRDLLVEGK